MKLLCLALSLSVLSLYSSDEVAQPSTALETIRFEAIDEAAEHEAMVTNVLRTFFKRHPSPLQENIRPLVAERIRELQSSARNSPVTRSLEERAIMPSRQIVLDSIQAMMDQFNAKIKNQQEQIDNSVSKKKAGGIAAICSTITAVVAAIAPIIIHYLNGSV